MLDTSLIHYPGIPMSRFGSVPDEFGGGNKYRIIWAPSRRIMCTAVDRTFTMQMYTGPGALEPVGDAWILEGWKAPWEMTHLTEAQWNADPMMLNLGGYPRNGDYVRHETLSCNPGDANIEKLISMIEMGRKRRPIENALFCQEALKADMEDRSRKRDALLRNAMRPWGAESYSARGGGRNSKTYPLLKSREELGLPEGGVSKAVRPRNPKGVAVMVGDGTVRPA